MSCLVLLNTNRPDVRLARSGIRDSSLESGDSNPVGRQQWTPGAGDAIGGQLSGECCGYVECLKAGRRAFQQMVSWLQSFDMMSALPIHRTAVDIVPLVIPLFFLEIADCLPRVTE
jgi:hypothetical protein